MARQMKDSGVEWMGEIPKEWNIIPAKRMFRNTGETKKDDDVQLTASQQYGIISQSDYMSLTGSRVVLATQDLEKWKHVEPLDFIISLRSFQGGLEMSEVTGCITWHYVVLRSCHDGINVRFYKWLFKSSEYITALQRTCNYIRDGQDIRYSNFEQVPLFLPKKEEQEKIANILDTKCAEIDKVVEHTRATIEEYKKLKQAIITEAVTKGVRGPRPMKPSGVEWIGDIPVGWYTSKAGRFIASTQNGLTRRDLSESSGDIVLKLRNITPDGTIDYSAVTRVKLSDAEKTAYTLEKGDFLFVRVNGSKSLVGKSAIFDGSDEDVAYNDHIIRVRLETNYSRAYFKWFLLSTSGKTEIDMRTSTSAGQFTISGQELRNIRLCVPSEEEQQEIAAYLDTKCAEIDRIIEKKEQLIEELGSYKKSLIYEYVTGKKEVTA